MSDLYFGSNTRIHRDVVHSSTWRNLLRPAHSFLGPRNRMLRNDGKRTRKSTIAKNKSRRMSSMNDEVAGMDARRQDIVQRDRFGAPQRNHGVRRICGAWRHIAG